MLRVAVADLDKLFAALQQRGYAVVGPTVRDSAIVYDVLDSADELPVGWTDEQAPGRYRLVKRDDQARFGYVVGPHSWKKYLFPPEVKLWQLRRSKDGFSVTSAPDEPPRYALFGVRSCELHAIAIQDRVFMPRDDRAPVDPIYRARRDQAFIVSVQCVEAGGTCFCASMDTGPRARDGFDLAITEIIAGDAHYLTIEVGSERGREVMAEVPHQPASEVERDAAERAVERAAGQMGRTLDRTDVQQILQQNPEHPRWDHVAERCLSCANCTMACPTCFCSTVEDTSDLTGEHAERWRRWDSCFTGDFSYLHGGSVRVSTRARYRQWLTHKLSTWIDQFGTSGCVGCGRCVTWCPVGIDITEEIAAIRQQESTE